MKIQELAANIGGIMKAVFLLFGFLSKQVGLWEIHNQIASTMFAMKEKKLIKKQITNIKGLKNVKANETNESNKSIGFCTFVGSRLCCSRESKFKKEMNAIRNILDIRGIFNTHLKVEYLLSTVLKEEGHEDFMEIVDKKVNTLVQDKSNSNHAIFVSN